MRLSKAPQVRPEGSRSPPRPFYLPADPSPLPFSIDVFTLNETNRPMKHWGIFGVLLNFALVSYAFSS